MSSSTTLWRFLDPRRSSLRRAAGNLGWPILQKEIRADFRKYGFFLTHLLCLSALSVGILWKVANQAERADVKPEDIGRDIFNTFFIIQYLVVVVVFPAFSANAFSEERSARTLDLLITTDLRPSEIVWGKFLASSVYCLIYIVATVPLLSVSLLFAGVSLAEIGAAYALLIGLTMLISMVGVCVSSFSASNVRATLIVYTISAALAAYSVFRWYDYQKDAGGQLMSFLEENVLPLSALSLLFFAYLFLFTRNRLCPRAGDRSSGLRLLTVVALLGAVGWSALALRQGAGDQEAAFKRLLFSSALGLFAAALLFTSEPAGVPGALQTRFSRFRGLRYPLRIFTPGSFWGLVYLLVLAGGVSLCLWVVERAVLTPVTAAPAPASTAPAAFPYGQCLIGMLVYLFAFGALGFFLSSLDFTPLYTALTVFFIFLITLLLPLIFEIGHHKDGILSLYYLSPITLWHSLEPDLHNDPEAPRYLLYGAPILAVAQGLFGALGALFTGLGVWRSRRKGYPVWSFPARRKAAPETPPAAEPSPAMAGAIDEPLRQGQP